MAFDVVFTSQKSGVSVEDRVAKHYHRAVGYVFPLFPFFCMFCTFFRSANVVEFSMFTMLFLRKESSSSRMNGLGMVKVHWEPKGCVAAQCLGDSNQGKA